MPLLRTFDLLTPTLLTPECDAPGCSVAGDQYTMIRCRGCGAWFCPDHIAKAAASRASRHGSECTTEVPRRPLAARAGRHRRGQRAGTAPLSGGSRRETTMQHTEGIALVAGATVCLGSSVLGAFVACTLGQAVAYRVLEQFSDQYIDLGPPARLAARPAEPASEQDLPHLPPATAAVRGARPQPTGTPALPAK